MARIRDNFPNVYVKVKHFCPLSNHLANVKQEAVTIVSHYSMPGHTGDGHAVVCIYISTSRHQYLHIYCNQCIPVQLVQFSGCLDTGHRTLAPRHLLREYRAWSLHTAYCILTLTLTCPVLTMLIVELSSFHYTFFHLLVHHI